MNNQETLNSTLKELASAAARIIEQGERAMTRPDLWRELDRQRRNASLLLESLGDQNG